MRRPGDRKSTAAPIVAAAALCMLVLSPLAGAGGGQVSAVTFSPVNSAAHATGNWAVGFKTPSFGGLAGGAGNGYVLVTFPDGFSIPPGVSGTWGSGFSCQGAPALGEDVGAQTIEIDLPSSCTLGSSTMGHVALHGITNPDAGVYSGAEVATSSNFTPVSAGDITITPGLGSPTISTTASADVKIGGSVTDTATLSGGAGTPTGTIAFRLYGPNDGSCSTPPAFTSTVTAVAGATHSASFAPVAPGKYRWRASYSGDGSNDAVAGACNAANESVVVSKATPALSTTASAATTTGHTIRDTAALSKGFIPTGTLAFTLYGPDDATCSGAPAFTSAPVTLSGNGGYQSAGFTPSAPGMYRWIASYAGDANNNAVTGHCDDAKESVEVVKPVVGVSGFVQSGSGSCVVGRTVSLFRQMPGSTTYLNIASTISNSNGSYKVSTNPVKSAGYYVRVVARTLNSTTCKAAQSSTIRYQGAQGASAPGTGAKGTPQPAFDTAVTIEFASS